jgi:hypothetical protein
MKVSAGFAARRLQRATARHAALDREDFHRV